MPIAENLVSSRVHYAVVFDSGPTMNAYIVALTDWHLDAELIADHYGSAYRVVKIRTQVVDCSDSIVEDPATPPERQS